jgi:glycerophosphoryl diester phosphodiesterase
MPRLLFALLCASVAGMAADQPAVIAHRGGAALKPENTLTAFRNAISLGVPVLEFDLNLTADDALVIHHDSSVNPRVCRPPQGVDAASIRTLTLAQIKRFDCGAGERMPTFEEFLRAVRGSGTILLGETKMPSDGGVDPVRFVELIDAAIRKYGVADRFVLQSADYRTTEAMRRRNPAVRICLLSARRFKPNYLEVARKYGATYLMLRYDDATPEQIRELKAAGYLLYSGTANTESDWQKYLDLGFDGILSDDPAHLQAFLKRSRPQP